MRIPRRQHLSSAATSLEAALTGAGPDVATPPLGRLGSHLRQADLGPSDSFRSELRSQLLMATPAPARVRTGARARRQPTWGGHPASWLATRLTAGLAAAGVMVTGVGVASARALPGDALYGVKRDAESVQLNLADGDSARGLLHLQFATSRLAEVHALLSRAGVAASPKSAPSRPATPVTSALAATLRSTLSAMDADTSTGASELTKSFLRKRQQASLTKLAAFTTQQETALSLVLPALPAPAAATSLDVLHTVAAQTTALLAEPASPTPAAAAASATPTPTRTPATATASPSTEPSSASPSASASASPSPSVASSASPSPSSSAPPKSPTPSPSSTPKSPTQSPTASASPTQATESPTASSSASPSEGSSSPSASASPTVTP